MDRIPLLGEVQEPLRQFSAILGDMNVKVRVWIVALWTAAAVVMLNLALTGPALPPWWILLGLGAIAAVAERQSVPVTRNIETSVSFLPSVFTAVAFGPL